jgi:hypothetical protein
MKRMCERKKKRGDNLLVHIYQYFPTSIPSMHCYGLWSKGERISTAPTFHLMKGCEMWQNAAECGGVAMWQRLLLAQFKSIRDVLPKYK